MSSSGRKSPPRDDRPDAGGRSRHGRKHPGPATSADKAKSSGGITGKVAAFLRGSLEVLAKGHRATFGRMMNGGSRNRKTDPVEPAKKGGTGRHHGTSSKSSGAHHARSSAHKASTPELSLPPADCRWIDTAKGLEELVEEIKLMIDRGEAARSFIDTEADSLHHYTEKLCLIQLAVGGKFALIDPLALPDMSALLSVLDRTEIWLHGADYDLTLLKKTYGWSPHRICDTQIAARLCGHRPFGLAALVERHCGVVLCKSSQKADWSQRPLPTKMQAYAVDDVRYLGRLADLLMAELTAKKRLSWFEQTCATLRSDVLKRPDRDREDAWRITGCGRLRPDGLAVLRELWLWRDSTACERDVPPFKVLNNQQLLAIATDFEETGRAEHPPRWRSGWRDGFRAAVERARSSDPETWPQQPKHKRRHITESQKDRIEKLCLTRDRKADALGIESSLLGSRATLEAVVLQPSEDASNILMPWQREVLGDV